MGINGRWRKLVVLALITVAGACATEPKKEPLRRLNPRPSAPRWIPQTGQRPI